MKKIDLCLCGVFLVVPVIGIAQSLEEDSIQTTEEERSASYPSILLTEANDGLSIIVEAIYFSDVQQFIWNEEDITEKIKTYIQSETIKIIDTPYGFNMVMFDNSWLEIFQGNGYFSIVLPTGTKVTEFLPFETTTSTMDSMRHVQSATKCSWLNVDNPTSKSATITNAYDSNSYKPHHTGIDYSVNSKTYAVTVANGKVERVEPMNSFDHGMGNNVIVSHKLSDCSTIYSTYSHLESIDSNIKKGNLISKGDKIGVIGASGYGDKDCWLKTATTAKCKGLSNNNNPHLHFEMKLEPVTGNPYAYKGTAKDGVWGYTPYHPDNYGYRNPKNYINK